MSVAWIVQHHPSRADLLPQLLPHLPDAQIVTDPGGELSSAWRTYRLCLRAETDASHLAVIQDDVVVPEHFAEAATAAVAAKPGAVVVLCLCGQPARTALEATLALKRRECWARLQPGDWLPTIATVYPTGVARRLADWVDERKPAARGDDSVAGEFMKAHRRELEAWVTVPSLAHHPDTEPSLIGRRHMGGRNPGRVTKYMVEGDPRRIKW